MKQDFDADRLTEVADQLRAHAQAVQGLIKGMREVGVKRIEINNTAGLERAYGLIEDFLASGQEMVRRAKKAK